MKAGIPLERSLLHAHGLIELADVLGGQSVANIMGVPVSWGIASEPANRVVRTCVETRIKILTNGNQGRTNTDGAALRCARDPPLRRAGEAN
jgi:hypothetical protein